MRSIKPPQHNLNALQFVSINNQRHVQVNYLSQGFNCTLKESHLWAWFGAHVYFGSDSIKDTKRHLNILQNASCIMLKKEIKLRAGWYRY
jgi:hypothetical protein